MPSASETNPVNPYASPKAVDPGSSVDLSTARDASRRARLRAAMIDFGMYLLAAAGGSAVSFLTKDLVYGTVDTGELIIPWSTITSIAGAVSLLGAVQWALVAYEGQTIGKKAAKIRIVRMEDGGNPGFLRAVLLRVWVPMLFCSIPMFGPVFLLLDTLTIFGPESRCLHDYFARTRVVRLKRRKKKLGASA